MGLINRKTLKNQLINKPLIKNNLVYYNNKWDYSQILYNYNNNNLLNNQKYKYLIYKYISYMLNQKYEDKNKQVLNILYKKPIILYNTNCKTNSNDIQNTILLFIYKPLLKNNNLEIINSDTLIYKLINNIITSDQKGIMNNDFIKGLTNFKIKPILLTYDYLDSEIYSKSLGKLILKDPKFDRINNISLNEINNVNLIKKFEIKGVMNKINKLLNLSERILLRNEIKNVDLWYNKDNYILNNLLYKNIIGYDWKYRGKNYNSESNARALRYYMNKGKLNLINKENRLLKLNNYGNNLTKGQSYVINKNGKYNINVTLSHY